MEQGNWKSYFFPESLRKVYNESNVKMAGPHVKMHERCEHYK